MEMSFQFSQPNGESAHGKIPTNTDKLPEDSLSLIIKRMKQRELIAQMIDKKPDISSDSHVSTSSRNEQASGSANDKSKDVIQQKSFEGLSKDLEQVLNTDSSCFSDVILKCDDVSIPAHKVILSARSPVFAAMFANPMKENCKNEVDITDIDESVVRALLLYIYTGQNPELTVMSATDLLFAADKYQVQELKTVCIHFLKNTVTPQNVWDILVLGDMHSEDLKTFATDYICNKCGEFSAIEKHQEWKILRKEKPDLAMDLLESMVKYRDQNMKSSPNSTNHCKTAGPRSPYLLKPYPGGFRKAYTETNYPEKWLLSILK